MKSEGSRGGAVMMTVGGAVAGGAFLALKSSIIYREMLMKVGSKRFLKTLLKICYCNFSDNMV